MQKRIPTNKKEAEEWDLHDRAVRNDISDRGFHVGLVPAIGEIPGWAFSIGLSQHSNHPDLICFGPDVAFVGGLIQLMSRKVCEGEVFSIESPIEGILSEHKVFLRRVEEKWTPSFLGNASYFYGRDNISALQIFWPDHASLFPWDTGFDPSWRDAQPFLYEAETHRALPDKLLASLLQEGAL